MLTTLRLLLGPIALALRADECSTRWIYLPILIPATLSDIYDGILARRFGVATPALRRYDSITDVILLPVHPRRRVAACANPSSRKIGF